MSSRGSEHEAIEALLPWFANGTLDRQERGKVEAHLRRCARCRESLDCAQEQAGLLRHMSPEACAEEVDPRLLTEYAERPEMLDDETVRWIEDCLRRSPLSREALARLREAADPDEPTAFEPSRESRSPAVGRERRGTFWSGLASMFLRPAPALVYLLLLLILVPAAWWMKRGDLPEGAIVPTVLGVEGERATRTDAAPPPAPLELPAKPPGGILILELETELSASDLVTLGAAFDLEIHRGGRMLWSGSLAPESFRMREGTGVVTVTLRPARFRADVVHEIIVRADKPGDPLDGQALFRRPVRFSGE